MIGFMIYCAGIVVGIVGASWVIELIENNQKNSWRSRVTAEDIEQLRRLFEEEGATVAFNEKGEKFLVGYSKE